MAIRAPDGANKEKLTAREKLSNVSKRNTEGQSVTEVGHVG